MTTAQAVNAHVLGKIQVPQPCIHLPNWSQSHHVAQQPICIARSSCTLSSLPSAVGARSVIRYGRLSSYPSSFPFLDHNSQGFVTASFDTARHSALKDVIQEPATPSIKDEPTKSDPVQNEEAEGQLKAPLMRLRSLLQLQDIKFTNTNVHELLVVADYLERFGLDIYFREEIKCILDHAFRIWTDISSGKTTLEAYELGDLKSSALAFYLLRSHEYEVSPRIFRTCRKDDGSFVQRAGDETSPAPDVIDLLNLLRASDLRFRRDAVLHEAFTFSSAALQRLVDWAEHSHHVLSEKATAEVRYRLKYPWTTNFKMLETKQTVTNFQTENVAQFSRLSLKVTSLMLALATQIVNEFIPVIREEFNYLDKWAEDTEIPKYDVRPPRMAMFPFGLGYAYNLPPLSKYAHIRVFHAKLYYLLITVDDLMEAGASVEDLQLFLDAIKRWDPSLIEKIPPNQGPMPVRLYFKAVYDMTNEAVQQASFWHGRDVLQSFIEAWLSTYQTYFNERLWEETCYQPTADEYVNEYAKISFAAQSGCTISYYCLPWEVIGPEFLRTRPDMKVIHPLSAGARYLNDIHSYGIERAQPGKDGFVQPRLIDILMRENPKLTENDAMEEARVMGEVARQEVVEELLCTKIPYRGVKDILLSNFRITYHIYTFVDGLRDNNHEVSYITDELPPLAYEID